MSKFKPSVGIGLLMLLFSGLSSCGLSEPKETSYDNGSTFVNSVSDGEFFQDESVQTFTIEYYPITMEQLDNVDVPSGDPDVIDIWHLTFRGIDLETSAEILLEVAYSPDSELMYINVLHPSFESVVECETSRTELFVDLVNYIKSEQYVFMDGSEFAFGIPGMYHFPQDSIETFSLSVNEYYIIARGRVAGQSRPEIDFVIDSIKSDFLGLVLEGGCD